MRPVLVARVQGLLNQQSPETGTIDEQVALYHLPGLHDQGFDKTGAFTGLYCRYFTLYPGDTEFFTVLAQKLRHLSRARHIYFML